MGDEALGGDSGGFWAEVIGLKIIKKLRHYENVVSITALHELERWGHL